MPRNKTTDRYIFISICSLSKQLSYIREASELDKTY